MCLAPTLAASLDAAGCATIGRDKGGENMSEQQAPDKAQNRVPAAQFPLEWVRRSREGDSRAMELLYERFDSEREDGTPLPIDELKGYRMYWGKTEGAYLNSQDVAGGKTLTGTVTCIDPGDWYFVVTARDTFERESKSSNVIKKTFASSPPAAPSGLGVILSVGGESGGQ